MTREGAPVSWAIVGASQIARAWVADAIRAAPGGELAAIVSRDHERAANFARDFRIPKAVTALDDVLADPSIDALYISTSNDRHAAMTLAAAAAGKHVLCEKPLSLSVDDAVGMAQACDRAGVILGTNHHLRGAATLRAIRDLVQSGSIGRPLAARAMYCEYLPASLQTWRTSDPNVGGVILDLTTHSVDALRFVLSDEPIQVVSMKAASLIGSNGVEDQTQSIVRFGSGLLAYLHEGYAFAHHETAFEVHGTDGSVYGRGILDEAPSGQVFVRRGKEMSEVALQPVNLYESTVAQFNRAVRGMGTPAASGWDGAAALATALAIRRAAETGRSVEVPDLQRA
jgi:1,5-anhydro-D-fructose reductase (1,5-anhydro-D-mannitol-forming)